MITPAQIPNPYVKPKWQAPVGVMESVVAYNCRKYGMPRPVLALPMWEGAGNLALDYSGRGNHGTLVGGATWVAEGIDFDGTNGYVDAGDIDIIGDKLTLSAQIVPDFIPTDDGFDQIMDKAGLSNTHAWRLLFQQSIDGFRFRVFTSAGVVNCDTTGLTWNASELHHIVAVYDGSTMKIYWDGIENNSANHSGNITANDINVFIGYSDGASVDTHFKGIINNPMIFNAAFSTAQVKFISDNPYFMYQIPEELYGYVAGAPPTGNPFWYYNMLKRRN